METFFLNTSVMTGVGSLLPPPLDPSPNPNQLTVAAAAQRNASVSSRFSFGYPLRSLFSRGRGGRRNGMAVIEDAVEDPVSVGLGAEEEEDDGESWVFKILHARSLWGNDDGPGVDREPKEESSTVEEEEVEVDDDDEAEGCDDGCAINDDKEEKVEFDRDSFSRLLTKVSLPRARLYAQMSYLGNLAYSIHDIKVLVPLPLIAVVLFVCLRKRLDDLRAFD